MSAHGMKPVFRDRAGYMDWIKIWKQIQADTTALIRDFKRKAKEAQRNGDPKAPELQRRLTYERAMGSKTMKLLEEARIHYSNIKEVQKQMEEQQNQYPLEVKGARNIEFHFNKKHLEIPTIPMWVLKFKGSTWYVNNVTCAVPWSTKERPDHPSTKGSIRIKRGDIHINENGDAIIS